eukprot:614843-Amphidinium_carterae.2
MYGKSFKGSKQTQQQGGKKGGKKGGNKAPTWSDSQWGGEWASSQPASWGEGEGSTGTRTTRLTANYTFAKATLRAYADRNGSCLHASPNDTEFLKVKALKEHLSAESSNLMRFPAVGLSIAGGSMKAGIEVVNELHADHNRSRLNDIFELFDSDDGKGFLEAMSKMNTGGDARTPPKKEIGKSLEVITKFVDTHAKRLEKDMGL